MSFADDRKFETAVSHHQSGNVAEAAKLYRALIKSNPKNYSALHFLGIIEAAAGNIEQAKLLMARSMSIQPPNIQFAENYATILFQTGDTKTALEVCQQGLKINATSLPLRYVGAISNFRLGYLPEALAQFDKVLASQPGHIPALNERGSVLAKMKQYDAALASIEKALSLNPSYAEAHLNKGNIYSELKRRDEASAAFDRALALQPALAEAWLGRGAVLRELKRYDESLAAYDRALALKPGFAEAWAGRGNVFTELKRNDDALAAYDKALAFKPDLAEACVGRGNVFTQLKRYDEALAAYDKALVLNPDLADAWLGRGIVFTETERSDDAFAAYARALALAPDRAEAWLGRGNTYTKLRRHDDAFAAYDKAFALKPDLKDLEGARLYAKMFLCDWRNFDAECAHLTASVRDGKVNTAPFVLLGIPSTAAEQLRCTQLYAAEKFPAMPPLKQGKVYNHDRVRVAYLSSDYRAHAIAYLIAEVIELHARNKFEVVGISYGPDDQSDIRARIAKSFEQFHDVRDMGDEAVAALIEELEIDIAVDLNNYTDLARPGILARRPAPIQVSYLGYPATMAVDFIDYAIADKFVLPADQQQYWTEKIVTMPGSYLAHDTVTKRNMPAEPPTRAQAGLPENAFVFCCFNNSFKITPEIFAVWMRLLKAVDGSVAWLSPAGDVAQNNLYNAASQAGVDPARLIFAGRTERVEDHLSRHRAADLFLDTLPYNAHTTAADALWAGLPVVTCVGETFPARVAGSLLHAIGLPELVTQNLDDYEALALQLARDSARLAALKVKLARNRDTHPLFDTARFTRHLETAYGTMVARHRRGEPPAPFAVDAPG